MSFRNTKTPNKPTGKAKWQVPMRESRKHRGLMEYYLEGELKEKFCELFPKNSNRRLMQWFGISFSTLQRFKREFGLQKDETAIRKQLAKDVKKICEKNGYYDSLRGKPINDACKAGRERLRATGFHPMLALKEQNPRKYKAALRRKSKERKELIASERRRMVFGLPRQTNLINITLNPLTHTQSVYKCMMKKKYNYFTDRKHPRWICYDSETQRSERSEATARKHGFTIVEGEG